jgi:hypothetical protein
MSFHSIDGEHPIRSAASPTGTASFMEPPLRRSTLRVRNGGIG